MVTTPTHGQANWDIPLNAALNDLQDQININPAADAEWQPADQAYIAWTVDPINATVATSLTNGSLALMRLVVRAKVGTTVTVTNLEVGVNNAGSGFTAGQNFAAIYNTAGTRLGVTADQSVAWTTVGHKTMALTAPILVPPGYYWIAALCNATTPPQLLRATNAAAGSLNSKTTAATSRFGSFGAGLTATPASFAPASITPGLTAWFGGLS